MLHSRGPVVTLDSGKLDVTLVTGCVVSGAVVTFPAVVMLLAVVTTVVTAVVTTVVTAVDGEAVQ
jgi:hypothetical protein